MNSNYYILSTATSGCNTFSSQTNNLPIISLGDQVKQLEERVDFYTNEYINIRSQILNIRAILGLPRNPEGQDMKMSIALKELALELDKRADIFGNIDPMIKL